jgi:putative transferase (TIGR04331 family)
MYNNLAIGIEAPILAKENDLVILNEFFPKILRPDIKKRKVLKKETSKIENWFIQDILCSLPYSYVECFSSYYERIPELDNPENYSFHRSHTRSIFTDFLLAKYRDLGAKVIHYQPGCGHGENSFHPNASSYEMIDQYVTFGWTMNEKDIEGRAHRIEGFGLKYKSYSSELDRKKFDLLIVLSHMKSDYKIKYKNYVEYLIENIDKEKYKKILLRPRPRSRFVNNKREVKHINLDQTVQIDDGKGSLASSMALCNANCLLYTPATNLYECIYVNQPIIGLDMYLHTSDIFEKHLEFFREVGIMHKNIESLTSFLNQIDIDSWWKEVMLDKRMHLFIKDFLGNRQLN